MTIRRVLVLTSDTGAGHRSVAEALQRAARARPDSGLELEVVDPLAPLAPALCPADSPDHRVLFDRIARLYAPVIVHVPWLWGWTFHGLDNTVGLAAYLALFGATIERRIADAAGAWRADAIVSVHPLVNHLMARARARLGRPQMPLLTVLTDLVNVHRWWACPEVDQYVAGSHLAAGQLNRFGIVPQRIAVLGIPLRHEIATMNVSAREMRLRLRLDPDLPTLLLLGGGDGAGRLAATAQAIAQLGTRESSPRFQLVTLTGRNQRAEAELAAHRWPIPTRVGGFVPNVLEYMTAADVIATKPGSLTICEALALGRALLLGKPLPGQEASNVGYVVEAGAGLSYRSPAEAAEAAAFLLAHPAARWEMGQCAARLSYPRATDRTLDLLRGQLLRADQVRAAQEGAAQEGDDR